MKYLGKIAGLSLLAITINCHSGINKTTVHSRANCLNNESITWWLGHPYLWRVVSVHKSPWGSMHEDSAGYDYNDRVAVVHWLEGLVSDPWQVWGYHIANISRLIQRMLLIVNLLKDGKNEN